MQVCVRMCEAVKYDTYVWQLQSKIKFFVLSPKLIKWTKFIM